MNPKEQEIAIKELEERVDRLRNIYEQYFLGFERLEPTVPRKDVDRRLALLRKEQIRNTAMRFKLNVIVQKYNTYAMHWIRICRQIEEGTYKRHIRRAKARFGELSSSGPERDVSIDVDIGDFDMDMDVVPAEANAAAESFERPAPDTIPPPAPEAAAPPTSERAPGSTRPDRAQRSAVLPAGSKPRIVVRRREEGDPASARAMPAALPSAGAQGSARIPVAAPVPGSVGRVAAAPPPPALPASAPAIAPAPAGSAPSVGRQPVSPPGAAGHKPQIRPVGSGGRIPVAAPASAQGPAAPAAPGQSVQRIPAAPPPPPPRRPMPSYVEKDTDPGAPHARPPGTKPRLPLPLPSQARPPPKKE